MSLTSPYGYFLVDDRHVVNEGTILLNGAPWLQRSAALAATTTATLTNAASGEIVKNLTGDTTAFYLPFDNAGTLHVSAGTLATPPDLTSGGVPAYDPATKSFTGGTYEVAKGGQLRFSGTTPIERTSATFDIAGLDAVVDGTNTSVFRNLKENTGSLTFGDGSRVTSTDALVNGGSITLLGDSDIQAASYTQTAGSTRLVDSTTSLTTTTISLEGGTVSGRGALRGSVTNSGATIAPGNSPGTLVVDGDFTQTTGGTMSMEIGAGAVDALDVSGTASLGGAMQLVVDPTIDMTWQSAFSVVKSPAIVKDTNFAVTGLPKPADGLSYEMVLVDGKYELQAIDTTKPTNPTAAGTSSHTPQVWSSDQTISLTHLGAGDDISGVAGYSVAWDTSPTTVPEPRKTHDVNATTSPTLVTGNAHYVHVRSVDGEGNWADGAYHLGPYYIDATGPAAAKFTSSAPTTWTATASAPTWAAGSDAGQGTVSGFAYAWTKSGSPGTSIPANRLRADATSVAAPTADGIWYLHLWSKDGLGNWGAPATYGAVRIDATRPAAPALTSTTPAGTWVKAAAPVTWSSTGLDAGSGVDGFALEWTKSATPATTPTAKDVEENETSAAAPTSSGSWHLHVWAVDAAGNVGAPATYGPVNIDVDAPTAPALTSATAAGTWTKSATVAWSLPGDGSGSGVDGFTVAWSTSSTPGATPTSKQLAATALSTAAPATTGSWYLHAWSVDKAGNWSTSASYGPVNIDVTAPAVPTLSLPSATIAPLKATTVVKWSGSDAGSGVATYAVQRSWKPLTATGKASPWKTEVTTTTGQATVPVSTGTRQCVRVVATDKVGLVRTSNQRCVLVPFDDLDFTASKSPAWKKLTASKYAFGSARTTQALGATLKGNVKGKKIGVLAWTCSTCGSVSLQWGTQKPFATISLKGAVSKKPVALMAPTLNKVMSGTLVVKTIARGKVTTIDAIVVR